MQIAISQIFDFPLDAFQLEAIEYLDEGKSVVVCSPTGSGKTVVAEYAVEIALANNKRCFYTTPLKALSNQKFGDFKLKYGEAKVGLLTGDASINRDAAIVVMTTEVFRNMLYGTILGDIRQNLKDVSYVVLDECHYMNDAQRGTVWEESIIYAPYDIQLVALSATIANGEELTAWVNQIHGPTALVSSSYRPVPLRFHYFGERHLYPLLNPGGGVNTQLTNRFGKRVPMHKLHKKSVSALAPDPGDVLSVLSSKSMLPAIYFLFSRKGCEDSMSRARGIPLISKEEEIQLKQVIEEHVRDNQYLSRHPHLPYLYESMAVHHAGMLPSWKALIEKLFHRGLLKVVFATETLAAGINMPARTTVISSLSKRADEGRRELTASEFLQMSGRAGRRGMDEIGHVVVLHHPFEPVDDAARLATAVANPLSSRFTPSYGMALNLLQRHTLEESRELIERSFGQFVINLQSEPLLNQRVSLEQELVRLQKPLCPDRIGDLPLYTKKIEAVKSAHKQMKLMEKGFLTNQSNKTLNDEAQVVTSSLRTQIEQTLKEAYEMPCHGCPVQKPCAKQSDSIQHLEAKIKDINQKIHRKANYYFSTFMSLCEVLQNQGYLNDSIPTNTGKMAAGLRGTNELFLAEVALSDAFVGLEPAEAAAVLTALVSEEGRAKESELMPKISPGVAMALDKIGKIARRLFRLQREFNVEIPIQFSVAFSSIAQAWAQGTSWENIMRATTYDEGDIVRVLRRALDLSRQFTHAPNVPDYLVRLCSDVESLIARDELKQEM